MEEFIRCAVKESWIYRAYHLVLNEGRPSFAKFDGFGDIEYDIARARIASCAPDALRMLEYLEYSSGKFSCNFCDAVQNQDHDPNCGWLNLMRKAGLR